MAFLESIPALREAKRDGKGLCFHLPCCLGCVVPLTEKSIGSSVKQTPGAAGRHYVPDKDNFQELLTATLTLHHTFVLSNYRLSPGLALAASGCLLAQAVPV